MNRYTYILALCALAAACQEKAAPKVKPEARERIQALIGAGDSNVVASLAQGDTLHLSKATVDFYRIRRYRPAWIGDQPTELGQKLILSMSHTQNDGLNPNRYRYDELQKMVNTLGSTKDEATRTKYSADVDVFLTEAFTRYATDVAVGTLDPDSSGLKWRIPRGAIPKADILRALLKNDDDPEQIMGHIRPAVPQYGRLMKVLRTLDAQANKGGWGQVPAGDIKVGDSSAVVVKLRDRLARSEDPREAAYAEHGAQRPAVYDQDLYLALKHFQNRNGIEDDGRLGDKTLRELNHPIEDRIQEVRINMDRWRWLPHDLGNMYVMVNVAGYEMSVIENNHPIEAMNVVVGKTGWETPIFADTMEDMVINPSWNVPPSIAASEMGNVSDDYLTTHHFVRTSDGGYRQLPGADNALGQFKFEFPNKDNIYLHDTPADALFSRTDRAFSHGCIRLERPRDLAYLLGKKLADVSEDEIDRYEQSGDTHVIRFKRQIPVYILYFTTWVDEDGTVRFHHDVYGHDEALQPQTTRFDSRAS